MSFNKLSPAEAERLALLMEEAGEVVQAIGKILRHGYSSPPYDNRKNLENELGDLTYAIALAEKYGDVGNKNIVDRAEYKSNIMIQYLHHQDWEILHELRENIREIQRNRGSKRQCQTSPDKRGYQGP